MYVIELEAITGDVGWAKNDPIEGWIGTFLKETAERFENMDLASKVIVSHYKNWKGKVTIKKDVS